MLLSEGQMSDYKGAALMIDALPQAKELLGDKGYDAGRFRHALAQRGITACIPSRANRKTPIQHDRILYRQCHKIENMFGRSKVWRRVYSIGPMRPHLHNRHRRNYDILDQSMSAEPSGIRACVYGSALL